MRMSRQNEPESPGWIRSRSNSSSSMSSPPPPSLSPAASDRKSARGAVLLSLFLAVISSSSSTMVDGFVLLPPPTRTLGVFRQPWTETTTSTPSSSSSSSPSSSVLMAGGGSKKTKNKKVKKKRPGSGSTTATGSGGGFGGAALQICPCGSGSSYNDCCGKIHSDVNMFRRASPSDVVRARYSAYARRDADFLIASTHPSHKDWKPPGKDRSSWKETIKTNMYDNFDFNNCIIVREDMIISPSPAAGALDEKDEKKDDDNDDDDDGKEEEAVVQFIAEMTLSATGEKTSFMETSTFAKKSDGPWLYREGTIEAAPPSPSSSSSSSDTSSSSSSKDDHNGEEVIATSSDDNINEIPATLLEGLTK